MQTLRLRACGAFFIRGGGACVLKTPNSMVRPNGGRIYGPLRSRYDEGVEVIPPNRDTYGKEANKEANT